MGDLLQRVCLFDFFSNFYLKFVDCLYDFCRYNNVRMRKLSVCKVSRMKKISSILLLLLCSLNIGMRARPANAEDEIPLFPDKMKLKLSVSEQSRAVEESTSTKVLKGGIDLLSPKGLEINQGIIKSTRLGVVYDGQLKFIDTDKKDFLTNHEIGGVEVYSITKFKDDKTELKFMYNFLRKLPDAENTFTEKISEISLSHKITPNQLIIVGQNKRIPLGIDGLPLPQYLDTALRAQTARTFSNTRAFGLRNIGTYKYAEYDIGVYDSTRYWQDFFNGAEFVGWVNVKPLANLDAKKYGNLTIGAGGQVGSAKYDYKVVGTYLGYDYKKAHAKLEYMHADGYNGNSCSNKEAGGFHSTIVYDLTKKIQLVGRYDIFDPNEKVAKNNITEYTAGINYLASKQLKFLLNYVRQNKQNGPDSNMFLFVTRFML